MNITKLIHFLSFGLLLAGTVSLMAKDLPDPDGKPAGMSKPVQVFLIMGQSNTLEMGKVKGDKEGSLEYAIKEENLYIKKYRVFQYLTSMGFESQEIQEIWETIKE